MEKSNLSFGPPNCFDFVTPFVWKGDIPLKVKAFGWRCFKHRIPTKVLLKNRGILLSNSNLLCPLCDDGLESPVHLFFSCKKADDVWKDMANWIGLVNYKEVDFKESFWTWRSFCRSKKVSKGKVGC